jgi:ribosomal protein S18 acetylase RimI-like enzyme
MITYTESLASLEASQPQGGFFVGWPNPPSPTTHLKILQGSSHVVLALDGPRVIGFINAISDGVLTAYIPLLEVLPAYQKRGIGAELVRRMLERLKTLYMIDVLCDPEVQPFYERVGMLRASGMIVRNYDRQSGA